MLSFLFIFTRSANLVIGVDFEMDCFRVGIPDSPDSVFLLDSKEISRAFPTTFEITPKTGPSPRTVEEKNIDQFNFRFLAPDEPIKHPEMTVVHPANFIGKLSTHEFLQQNYKRKYYHSHTLYANAYHCPLGLHAQTITTAIMHRIKQKLADGGADVSQTILACPKFWVQSQREAIYYPAKQLKLNPRIIDSTTAIGSHICFKHRNYINKFPHRFLALEIGKTSCQSIIFEITRKDRIFAHEVSYSHTDRVGVRDFECVVADLIQKQTKTPTDPLMEVQRVQEAQQVIKNLEHSHEYHGLFHDIPYKITRQQIESACQDLLQQFCDMIMKNLQHVPNIEIDLVEVVGPGAKVFAIKTAIKKLFGKNRISIDKNPEEFIAIGAALLATQKVNIDTIPCYPISLVHGNEEVMYMGTIPFKRGTVYVTIPKGAQIPIGVPSVITWGNVTDRSSIYNNPSHIIKIKNSETKMQRTWLSETMYTAQYISSCVHVGEKTAQLKQYIEYMIGNYSQDLEESESMNAIMTNADKEGLKYEIERIGRFYYNNRANATIENLLKIEELLKTLMSTFTLKKDNILYLETTVEKFLTKVAKLSDDIKNMVELFKNQVNDEFIHDLLRPLAEAQIWFEHRYEEQTKMSPEMMPKLWWYDVERKMTSLDLFYKNKFKELSDEFKNSGKKL